MSEKKLECFHTSCHLSEGLEGKGLGGDSRNCPVGGKGLVGVGYLCLSPGRVLYVYISHIRPIRVDREKEESTKSDMIKG